MFSEYILRQYLASDIKISDVISWVYEEREIMSDKGSLNSLCQKNNPVFRN